MHKFVQSLRVLGLVALLQLGCSVLAPPQLAWAQTALGTLAASLADGAWGVLTTTNMVPTLDNFSGNAGVMTVYTDDMVWDPAGGQAFVIGNDHISPEGPQFVSYTASNNTWQRLARPAWLSALVYHHGYDHSAINQAARILYHRPYGDNVVHRYNIASQTWTVLTPPFSGDYANCCDALEYFPELGGLVWVRGNLPGVWLFHEGTQQWSLLGTVSPAGGTWQQAEYNPVHQVMIFTVGGLLYKLSNTGVITALNTPVSLYDGTAANGVLSVDPVSGDYIALTPTSRNLYRYNVLTDTWTAQSSTGKPDMTNLGVVATPVNTHGVIFFAACTRNSCQAYLYKHAPSAADTQAPTTPTNLVATAISSTQITLTWTASTDNVGVTGYNVSRGGTLVGTAPTASYADSGLTALTNYSYTVQAYDAAGNTSAQSASASATTLGTGGSDFVARCSAPGVVKCVGFDTAGDITGAYGANSGTLPGSVAIVLDTAVKASGASALKFTVPSNSGAGDSGAYFTNFSGNLLTQFGASQGFFVQWRQRFSSDFLTTLYTDSNGFKQAIVTTGDNPGCVPAGGDPNQCPTSCTAIGVVQENTYQRGFASLYNSCTGSTSHGPYDHFDEVYGADYKLQNARPTPYCLYTQAATSYFPPTGNCFPYFANEWLTFQLNIQPGPRVNDEFSNSFIKLWIAREGQASELIFNFGPYNLSAGAPADNERYGKIWFLPYQTNKNPAQAHPVAYTWYDELIISTNQIADPGAGGATLFPPTNLRLTP